MNMIGLGLVLVVASVTLLHHAMNWKVYRGNYRLTAALVTVFKTIPPLACAFLPLNMVLLLSLGLLGIVGSLVAWGVLFGYEHKSIKHSSKEISYMIPVFQHKSLKDSSKAQFWLLVGIDAAVVLYVAILPALTTTPK
jgi:hypothetical protein